MAYLLAFFLLMHFCFGFGKDSFPPFTEVDHIEIKQNTDWMFLSQNLCNAHALGGHPKPAK